MEGELCEGVYLADGFVDGLARQIERFESTRELPSALLERIEAWVWRAGSGQLPFDVQRVEVSQLSHRPERTDWKEFFGVPRIVPMGPAVPVKVIDTQAQLNGNASIGGRLLLLGVLVVVHDDIRCGGVIDSGIFWHHGIYTSVGWVDARDE